MRFVPKISLSLQLTFAFLLVIFLSWILSGATAYYLIHLDYQAMRQQVVARGGDPAMLPPAPQFTWHDVLIGPGRIFTRDQRGPQPQRRRRQGGIDQPPGQDQPSDGAEFAQPPGDYGNGRPPFGTGSGQPPGAMGPLNQPNAAGPNRQPGPPPPTAEQVRQAQMRDLSMLSMRLAIALALAVLAGVWLGRRVLKPLGELSRGAKAFRGGRLDHRIPARGNDEFTELAVTMNAMAERVSRQIADLEGDAQRRKQLLADVAHELRNPVMTLRTMSGAMAEGLAEDPERRARALASMITTSDRLFHLVTDLLELARLDLHELPLHRQPVDLHELAAGCVQAHQAAAQAAGITLLPVDGPAVTLGLDPDRVAQVVDNLLNNAISYAGAGASLRVTLQDGDPVRLLVADTGRGIPARHLPYVFDSFYRANAARTPGDAHSGLGLRIARGLIEAHGGTLELTSTEGQGTTVTMTLPREEARG